jgi:hypothetical protein
MRTARERGLDAGHEPDRLTAEEWLAHQRAAIAAEDAHRPVTETDIDVRDDLSDIAALDTSTDESAAPTAVPEAAGAVATAEADVTEPEPDVLGDVPSPEQDVLDVPNPVEDVPESSQDVSITEQDVPEATEDVLEQELDVPPLADDVPADARDVSEVEDVPEDVLDLAEAAIESVAEQDAAEDVQPPSSPAHVRLTHTPTAAELDLLVAAGQVALHRIAQRESQEAAHTEPEVEETYAADVAADDDDDRLDLEAMDATSGWTPHSHPPRPATQPTTPGTASMTDARVVPRVASDEVLRCALRRTGQPQQPEQRPGRVTPGAGLRLDRGLGARQLVTDRPAGHHDAGPGHGRLLGRPEAPQHRGLRAEGVLHRGGQVTPALAEERRQPLDRLVEARHLAHQLGVDAQPRHLLIEDADPARDRAVSGAGGVMSPMSGLMSSRPSPTATAAPRSSTVYRRPGSSVMTASLPRGPTPGALPPFAP